MKKFCLSVLIVISIVVLSGCSTVPKTQLIDENVLFTDEEICGISVPLIESSIDVYSKIMCCEFEILEKEKLIPGFDYIHYNSLMYYRLADLCTKDELWDFAYNAFTKSATKRLFSANIDGNDSYSAKFIEKNKSLYTLLPINYIDLSSLVLNNITPLSQSEDAFSVVADFFYTKAILHFVKEEGVWKIDNSVLEGEKEYQSTIDVTDTPSVITFIGDNEFLINRAELVKGDAVSESEAKEIFRSLLIRAEYVENILMHGTFRDSRESIIHNRTTYRLVDFPELKSLKDIWDNVLDVYTEESANRLYASKLDESSDCPKYIEKNGKLYIEEASRGNLVTYDYGSVKLIEQYENLLVLSIDQLYSDVFEKKQTFVIQQNEHGWRMSHAIYEDLKSADFQYENVELATIGEGEFFKYAPIQIDKFPVKFEYNGETITINAPIYTGLKTDNISTYKKFFAFENDVLVLTATTLNGKTNEERFLLLDKSGKLINTDYHSYSAIKDRAKISSYPNGIEILQTGESGAYQQQLYKDGVAISENFDEIGFFNNGLALARRGNKYGIISLDGETIAEPFIESDDYRYTPDFTRSYQVKHMTDDAFVLSVNGELVIFTITRGDKKSSDKIQPKNENTKEVYFVFPSINNKNYEEPEYVAIDDFVWGDYIPFVKTMVGRYANPGFAIYSYSFFTPETKTFKDGVDLYERFNNKYKVENDVIGYSFMPSMSDIRNEENKVYREWLFESKIVKVSRDFKSIERLSYIPKDIRDADSLFSGVWQSKYEMLEQGRVGSTYFGKPNRGIGQALLNSELYKRFEFADGSIPRKIFENEESLVFSAQYTSMEKSNTYSLLVVSKSDLSIKYEITVPSLASFADMEEYYSLNVNDLVNERYMLVTVSKNYYDSYDNHYEVLYLYDIEENSLTLLQDFAYDAKLSPDMKYLVYTDYNAELSIPEQQKGVRIKNLEDGKTILFSYDIVEDVNRVMAQEYILQGFVEYEALKRELEE
ncbi:MAG: hypothetical protein IKL05_00140 [Clostridia bacterium]|nr:hypothetical protein [Clostridia bacterium]